MAHIAMANQSFDLVVLGAGPGGYVAAIRAAQLGLSVAIVEKEHLGGVCLNWGCIPTKSLLRNAEVMEILREGKTYGFTFENLQVDYGVAHKRSRDVSQRLVKGVEFLMKKNKVTVITGEGKLKSANALEVNGLTIDFKNIIIATGARPMALPFLPVDGKRVLTSKEALQVQTAPKSMIVIGSGAIGMEFSNVFRAYGTEVTVLEALPRILPREDEEVSAEVVKQFTKQGIKTMAGVKVEGATINANSVTVNFNDGKAMQSLEAETVLVAISIKPNTENIGLEQVGVKTERGFIMTDDTFATNVAGVYAIGDVTGKLALAHVASAQGIIAAEAIAQKQGKYNERLPKLDYDAMPRCTYTHPQVASMGLTEAQAKEKGYSVKVSKFPFSANGRSLALNNKDGFIKIVGDAKYGEILGIHMVGPDVTELLPEFVLAKSAELTPDEIAHAVHAHPTLSEALMEAAHGVEGLPIHI